MKTSLAAAAFLAAGLALATSASAHQSDRSHAAPATAGRAFAAAPTQTSSRGTDGRFVVAATGAATGGPSGGPNQNGG